MDLRLSYVKWKTTLFRIWTLFTESNFYHNNYYNIYTSLYLQIRHPKKALEKINWGKNQSIINCSNNDTEFFMSIFYFRMAFFAYQ